MSNMRSAVWLLAGACALSVAAPVPGVGAQPPQAAAPSAQNVEQLRRDAEGGDAKAQFDLALAYVAGNGVTLDFSQAVQWLRKAADQGLTDAQTFLGVMYDTGRGVPQDSRQA